MQKSAAAVEKFSDPQKFKQGIVKGPCNSPPPGIPSSKGNTSPHTNLASNVIRNSQSGNNPDGDHVMNGCTEGDRAVNRTVVQLQEEME